jgi:hypothetical protein
MDPRTKEKEEHEDSKKEESEQPVIVSRITRLPAYYELTKRQSSRRTESHDEEQCTEDL